HNRQTMSLECPCGHFLHSLFLLSVVIFLPFIKAQFNSGTKRHGRRTTFFGRCPTRLADQPTFGQRTPSAIVSQPAGQMKLAPGALWHTRWWWLTSSSSKGPADSGARHNRKHFRWARIIPRPKIVMRHSQHMLAGSRFFFEALIQLAVKQSFAHT